MVDDPKIEERKGFMKPQFADPLKKREEFSVSLRRKKKSEIIQSKRKRAFQDVDAMPENETSFDKSSREINETVHYITSLIPEEIKMEHWDVRLNYLLELLPPMSKNEVLTDDLFKQKRAIMKFLRSSISTISQQINIIDALEKTSLLRNLSLFYGYLNTFPKENDNARDLKFEVTWILINLSSDNNPTVAEILLEPQYDILKLQSYNLFSADPAIIYNIIWFFANLCGEKDSGIVIQILKKTELLDFFGEIVNWQSIPPNFLNMLSWNCVNILQHQIPQPEVVQTVLKVLLSVSFQYKSVQKEKTRKKMARDIIHCINILICKDFSFLDQILEFDLQDLFEYCLSSEQIELMDLAVKTIGQLMSGNEENTAAIYPKISSIYRMIIHNVILALDLSHNGMMSQHEEYEYFKKRSLMKQSLWAMSNIAACPPYMITDFFDENVIDIIINVAQNFRGKDSGIFQEAMFVITNLVTNCTIAQFRQLLKRDIIFLLIQVLKFKSSSLRTLQNSLEALERYFHLETQGGFEIEGSIIEYFEASGGREALADLANHSNFEIYSNTQQLNEKYFMGDQENDMDHFFTQDFKQNANNIYDDTAENKSDEEQYNNPTQNRFII